MKRVVLAEKASVAQSLAKALGNYKREREYFVKGDTYITWAVGHLVENLMPQDYDPSLRRWAFDTLPFAPAKLRIKVIDDRRDRFAAIKQLLKSADVVVNACDAGREGELIARRILSHAGYKGPIKRLWISSYTDEAIIKGFRNLRDGTAFDNLYHSARVRSEGDWLVGINGTRAMSVRHGGPVQLTLGRVQTPVLAGLVKREQAIREFVPEPYWVVEAQCRLENSEDYSGLWFHGRDWRTVSEDSEVQSNDKGQKAKKKGPKNKSLDLSKSRKTWIKTAEQAQEIEQRVRGKMGRVIHAQSKRRRENPPQLFDLTSLQRIAHARYRLTAKETLRIAQSLYEKHKVITYPRTDSRYISEDIVETLRRLVSVQLNTDLAEHAERLLANGWKLSKRIVNNAKVTDHHAILPTARDPRQVNMNRQEWQIYELISRQLIAALSPEAEWSDTIVVTEVRTEDNQDCFITSGKILVKPGWRSVIPPRGKSKPLPNIEVDNEAQCLKAKVDERQTRPPPRYSEGTLLKFMETAGREIDDEELKEAMKDHGLGTPATRADIIEKLKQRRYIEVQQKSLIPTSLGEMLISLVPIEAIKSPEMTGNWEKRIREVQRGHYDPEQFRSEIVTLTEDLVEKLRVAPSRMSDVRESAPPEAIRTFDGPKKGGQYKSGQKYQNSRNSNSRSSSKKSKSRQSSNSGSKKRSSSSKKSATKQNLPEGTLGQCPRCNAGHIIRGKQDFGCNRWRSGCRFILRKSAPHGRELTDSQVKSLLKNGQTRPLKFEQGTRVYKGRYRLSGERIFVERIEG